ncbi:unnamed protein product [Amoebophrya sp. A25]|nr:unnamed protein product [Amoebophrya sp. A25]|eukprot:GSA25T00001329001.1
MFLSFPPRGIGPRCLLSLAINYCLCCLCLLTTGTFSATATKTADDSEVLGPVVRLLEDVEKETNRELDAVVKAADKVHCLCTAEVADLRKEVAEVKEKQLPETKGALETVVGLLGRLKGEIGPLTADLKRTEKDIKTAEKHREDERTKFITEERNLQDLEATCEEAAGLLGGPPENGGGGGSSTASEKNNGEPPEAKTVAAQLSTLLLKARQQAGSGIRPTTAMNKTSPSSPWLSIASVLENALHLKTVHEPLVFQQLGTAPKIAGMLKQMGVRAKEQLAESRQAEAKSVATFQKMKASRNEELNTLQKKLDQKQQAQADAKEEEGELFQKLQGAKKFLATSEPELARIEAECKEREADHDREKKALEEQLEGIRLALEALQSDEIAKAKARALLELKDTQKRAREREAKQKREEAAEQRRKKLLLQMQRDDAKKAAEEAERTSSLKGDEMADDFVEGALAEENGGGRVQKQSATAQKTAAARTSNKNVVHKNHKENSKHKKRAAMKKKKTGLLHVSHKTRRKVLHKHNHKKAHHGRRAEEKNDCIHEYDVEQHRFVKRCSATSDKDEASTTPSTSSSTSPVISFLQRRGRSTQTQTANAVVEDGDDEDDDKDQDDDKEEDQGQDDATTTSATYAASSGGDFAEVIAASREMIKQVQQDQEDSDALRAECMEKMEENIGKIAEVEAKLNTTRQRLDDLDAKCDRLSADLAEKRSQVAKRREEQKAAHEERTEEQQRFVEELAKESTISRALLKAITALQKKNVKAKTIHVLKEVKTKGEMTLQVLQKEEKEAAAKHTEEDSLRSDAIEEMDSEVADLSALTSRAKAEQNEAKGKDLAFLEKELSGLQEEKEKQFGKESLCAKISRQYEHKKTSRQNEIEGLEAAGRILAEGDE